MRYLVAAAHTWNKECFEERISRYPGEWFFVGTPNQLTWRRVCALAPRYIFFLHWSWKVPAPLIERFECVGFHMTDLPYGRGGSPLQHLILRGHRTTKLTAFRMTNELDGGPVYVKAPLPLNGRAQAIYRRASRLAATMMRQIIAQTPSPVPQSGRPTRFKRRTPAHSRLPQRRHLADLYDFIRMLDAEGYPRAFFDRGGFRYELSDAHLAGNRLTTRVTVSALPPCRPPKP